MNANEIVLIAACLISFVLALMSLNTIQQYHKSKGLQKNTKIFLEYLTLLVPIAGFVATRKLRKKMLP